MRVRVALAHLLLSPQASYGSQVKRPEPPSSPAPQGQGKLELNPAPARPSEDRMRQGLAVRRAWEGVTHPCVTQSSGHMGPPRHWDPIPLHSCKSGRPVPRAGVPTWPPASASSAPPCSSGRCQGQDRTPG